MSINDRNSENKLAEWFDTYWPAFVILFGLAFTAFIIFFKPHIGWANY